ncbi:MAG: c-type cytochrome [Rhodocyclaceae bacterium]|nr:c-type cytochrome [Rhodocyclaceae bacterium]MDZ4215030.1 c-type cytochrome [Rhodocyclaceae bacterium]
MTRFSLMTMFSVAALALSVTAHASDAAKPAPYQGDAAKGQPLASAVCGACHGPDGNSLTSANPKLAGQHAQYLFKQMKDFKANAEGKTERINPIMNGMIAPYTEEQMKDFAAYFAAQKQTGGEMKDREALALGQKLWRAGDASKGLPACAACHGPAGTGLPAQYPRLAGQFSEYTEAQLKAFRVSERANDMNKMMQMVAIKMTDAEIKAVADYIAGLH